MHYTHPDLLVSTTNRKGVGGVVIEPHPRRDMILDKDEETAFPLLERVPLEARVRMSVSGNEAMELGTRETRVRDSVGVIDAFHGDGKPRSGINARGADPS